MFVLVLTVNINSYFFTGKAQIQAEEGVQILEVKKQWQASHAGSQDVNNYLDEDEQQEVEDDPFADINDADLVIQDEVSDNEGAESVLGKWG